MEKPVLKDLLDLREKRGCLVSSTCGGAGQAVVEMHRLYTLVSAFENDRDMTARRETHYWVRHFRHHGDFDFDLSTRSCAYCGWFYFPFQQSDLF